MLLADRKTGKLAPSGFALRRRYSAGECCGAIYYMHYNFGRIHKTLRVAPAMEAGIADHVWTLEEIANLAE